MTHPRLPQSTQYVKNPIHTQASSPRFGSAQQDSQEPVITTDPAKIVQNNRIKGARLELAQGIVGPNRKRLEEAHKTALAWLKDIPGMDAEASSLMDFRYPGPFYRIVENAELQRLLTGENVSSSRHGGNLTDITNQPEYASISRIGKYRIQFKANDKFDPSLSADPDRPHSRDNSPIEGNYYLVGPYHLSDVTQIDYHNGTKWVPYMDERTVAQLSETQAGK
jgi:hypothetical protein